LELKAGFLKIKDGTPGCKHFYPDCKSLFYSLFSHSQERQNSLEQGLENNFLSHIDELPPHTVLFLKHLLLNMANLIKGKK
jgi:hypothetical protein